MLLGDDVVRLRDPFGGERMRAKVPAEALDGDVGEFFLGRLRVDDVLAVKLCEALEHVEGAVG